MTAILADTSSFIDFLRGADRDTLPPLILGGRILLSGVVKLELLAGVRRSECRLLDELLSGLAQLQDFPPLGLTQDVLQRARGRGLLGGLPDIMILADCVRNKAKLLSSDDKLVKLAMELKVKLFTP